MPSTWSIELRAEDVTVYEMALLMHAFRCWGEQQGTTIILKPEDPETPRPTADDICEVYEKGTIGARRLHLGLYDIHLRKFTVLKFQTVHALSPKLATGKGETS